MLNEIIWPREYLPGETDNFASNEIIVKGISAKDFFENLIDASSWSTYYENVSDIVFHNISGSKLALGAKFSFKTFGFPIEAEVTEFEAPRDGKPGRLAWHGWAEGDAERRLDVVHAWLLEDLPGGRVRILTQESQKGKPARDLFNTKPDVMNQGHQDWIKGLARTTLEARKARDSRKTP